MKASISQTQLQDLYEQAVETFPEEGCGLLAGLGDDERLILGMHQIENGLADERSRRYLIPVDDYRRTEHVFTVEGLDVVGVYHSHPDGSTEPTEEDARNAWPWFVYLIIGAHAGKAVGHAAWCLRDDRSGFDPVELVLVTE